MRKFVLSFLLAYTLLFNACTKNTTTPDPPTPPKPKADVQLAVSAEPFIFLYNVAGKYYWSLFNVVISEHNGVSVTVTTVKLEFYDGATNVSTVTYSGGTLPANGSVNVACSPVVFYYFDKMKIIVTGTDANGYSINATSEYTWI